MVWIENLIEYNKNGTSGKCPVCGGSDVVVELQENNSRKSVTFVCKDCNATDHFDGIKNSN